MQQWRARCHLEENDDTESFKAKNDAVEGAEVPFDLPGTWLSALALLEELSQCHSRFQEPRQAKFHLACIIHASQDVIMGRL